VEEATKTLLRVDPKTADGFGPVIARAVLHPRADEIIECLRRTYCRFEGCPPHLPFKIGARRGVRVHPSSINPASAEARNTGRCTSAPSLGKTYFRFHLSGTVWAKSS